MDGIACSPAQHNSVPPPSDGLLADQDNSLQCLLVFCVCACPSCFFSTAITVFKSPPTVLRSTPSIQLVSLRLLMCLMLTTIDSATVTAARSSERVQRFNELEEGGF